MNSSRLPASCVLFDLDGTLLDTAPDLTNALNAVLTSEGESTLSYDHVRDSVSHGSAALILLAFGNQQNQSDFDRRQATLLSYYEQNICIDTTIFLGMENVLDELEQQGISWGVVTNKPARFTHPLMDAIQLSQRACSIVCGDTLEHAKPDPEPLYFAANQCRALATECIYVGDAQRDIQAANKAGMLSLLASYGYINKNDQAETWEANGIIQSPEEILDWLDYASNATHLNPHEMLCH